MIVKNNNDKNFKVLNLYITNHSFDFASNILELENLLNDGWSIENISPFSKIEKSYIAYQLVILSRSKGYESNSYEPK